MSDVTLLLERVEGGDAAASEELYAVVYEELRRLARGHMSGESPGRTISATALVHEAWLRLVGVERGPGFDNRRHFFKAAAEKMRQILVDRARERGASKRGGGWRRLTLDGAEIAIDESPDGVLDLNQALRRFEAEHPNKAELVKLRFFAGLSQQEAAAVLRLPSTTADRHWAFAKAWLFRQLELGESDPAV